MKIRIGNRGETETFGPSVGRTKFQTNYVTMIAKEKDFDFFPINPMSNEKYRGPINLVFFTTDGTLHLHRVGVNRVLRRLTA